MAVTPDMFPLDNTSLSSCALSLCPSAATLFFLPSAYSLLFFTSLPGNVLSLWVFLRCIATVSPIHIYLTHLSISNLILSLSMPFLAAYYARGSVWIQSSVLCQLVLHGITPVVHFNIVIAMLIMTWVALGRFAVLIQHTHASRPSGCTKLLPSGFFACLARTSFARNVCVSVWVLALLSTVPISIYYSITEAVRNGTAAKGGCKDVCYNPAVEIGGSLSSTFSVVSICLFFLFYLLVLLFYTTVVKHIRRSRRSSSLTTSQSLLNRVLRNIVVIQVVISVCLLPYHIYKAIFISLVQQQRTYSLSPENHCHPLSTFIELKNCLLLLAALRGSTDPVMYFLLDKTFHHQTLRLLRCAQKNPGGSQACSAVGSANEKATMGTMEFSKGCSAVKAPDASS